MPTPAPTRIAPLHLLLAAGAVVAAIIAVQMLITGHDASAILAAAGVLTTVNFIATDVRNKGTRTRITRLEAEVGEGRAEVRELRSEVTELRGDVRELAAALTELTVQTKRNALGITETHRLETQAVQILTDLTSDPTGPQPIRPPIRRVQ